MSMVNDIMGLGRSAYTESTDVLEPEIANMRLEDAEDLEEGTDLSEFMLGVAYECDLNMRNMEMAIVCDEYAYLRENGEEMIYEEGRIQSVIDKFKKNTKWLWEQIQKYYKAALKKIDEFLKLDQRFLKKYKSKAQGNVGTYSGPSPEKMRQDLSSVITDIKKMENESTRVANMYLNNANFTNISNKSDSDSSSDSGSDFVKDNMSQVFKNIFGTESSDSASKAKDVYSAKMSKLKENKSSINKMDGSTACMGFEKCKELKSNLKDTYNNSKKVINSHLKAAKKAESVAKKFRVIPTKVSSAIHKVVKVLNTIGKWCAQANRYGVKLVNMIRNVYKAAIVSAASTDFKGKKKDVTDDEVADELKNTSRNAMNASALDLYEPGMDII